MLRRGAFRFVAAAAVLAAAILAEVVVVADRAPARAAPPDYTVTLVSGKFETRPSDAFDLLQRADGLLDNGQWTDLPFTFCYYGVGFDRIWVGGDGFLQFTTGVPTTSSTNTTLPTDASADGLCAVVWDFNSGHAWTWTAGTAPDRRFVVSWDDVALSYASNPKKVSFQVQLFERSGRIVLAYKPAVTGDGWKGGESYTVGLDAPGDTRYTAPAVNSSGLTGHPGTDYQLDPVVSRVTGRLLYDRLLSSASGVGSSVDPGVAAAGLRVEVRRSGAIVAASTTDADGDYEVDVCAPAAGAAGYVVAVADSAACAVRTATAAAPTSLSVTSSMAVDTSPSVGTLTLGSGQDAGGAFRAALEIAQTVDAVRSWCAARTTDAIPKLDVLYDPASTLGTSYTKASTGVAASMRIASAASGNEDAWDRALVAKEYARHVLAAVAGPVPVDEDRRFDAVTKPENAFAEGFGYHLAAVVLGAAGNTDGAFPDAKDATHGTSYDVESPGATVAPGEAAAPWVAATLYDLADAANETSDRFDGTAAGEAEKAFRAVDSATAAPTILTFKDLWIAAGYDPVPLVRTYVAYGLVLDDSNEPNDDAGEMAALDGLGTIRTGRVLNLHNEDWWSVSLPAASDGLLVDVVFQRAKIAADLTLQVFDPAGKLLVTSTTQPGFGPVRCSTGAVPAGRYRVRVIHGGGAVIDDYSVQALERLRIGAEPLPPWTEGRPYQANVTLTGGVAPVTLLLAEGSQLPSGLGVSSPTRAIVGTPSKPGTYAVTLRAEDAGSPFSAVTTTKVLVIHPALTLGLGEVAAFALARAPLTGVTGRGGTAPITTDVTSGRLPSGVTLGSGALEFTGMPDTEESVRFAIDGADVADSMDHAEVLGVVCVAPDTKGRSVCAMAEGDAGSGFFFDGVAGSTVTVGVATSRKQPKRVLRGMLLDADGTTPLTGGRQKSSTGKFSATGVVLPQSGRFYAAVVSASGAATSYAGTVKVAPPRTGKATSAALQPTETQTVEFGALAGAKLVLTAAPSKKGGASVRVASVTDPLGAPVSPGGHTTTSTKTGGVTLKLDLPVAGTWTVVLEVVAEPATIKTSYKITQPKGAVYAAE